MSDFDDDNTPEPKKKTGLNIKNTNSTIPRVNRPSPSQFEAKANDQHSKMEDYKKRTWDLSVQFKGFVLDRVLPINKSAISQNLEKETMEKLVTLASEMNEDDTQTEGIGAVALSMLLMKCMLVQRDIINDLAYKVDKLEKSAQNTVNESEKK